MASTSALPLRAVGSRSCTPAPSLGSARRLSPRGIRQLAISTKLLPGTRGMKCAAASGGGPGASPFRAAAALGTVHVLPGKSGGGAGRFLAEYAQKFGALGILLAADNALKTAFAEAGWSFPAPLAGMFMIIAALKALEVISPSTLNVVETFFAPALTWITRWLPLFYVPSLVMLPIILKQIPSAALVKVIGIVSVGMVLSLLITAQVAVVIRNSVKTEMAKSGPPSTPIPPPQQHHRILWGAVAAASLIAAVVAPGTAPTMVVPFMLAGTVGGYLIGMMVPAGARKVLHPIITTCLVGIGSAAIFGAATGAGFEATLKAYKTAQASGAGDILMSFLGIVILSFGFRVFAQRELMVRHRYEILGCTFVSAVFSLYSTVIMGRALGLDSLLTLAIAPRAVTVALALPIAQQLQAAAVAGVTATAVCFEGLMGASFAQPLLNKFGFRDPIVRGMSTAGAAHGLGTASLAANEPDALPFCALAYAIIGIIATLVSCVPFVRYSLFALAGAPAV